MKKYMSTYQEFFVAAVLIGLVIANGRLFTPVVKPVLAAVPVANADALPLPYKWGGPLPPQTTHLWNTIPQVAPWPEE
jgi:hypothetical protein